MARVYHPVDVDIPDGTFQIHMGNPGKPRVYRKLLDGSLRRVPDKDPILWEVAKAFRDGVDKKREAEEAELARKRRAPARFFRWIGETIARIWFSAFPMR